MRRRTVLATAGATVLAGCLGSSSGNDSPSNGDDGTTTDAPGSSGAAGEQFTVSNFDVSTKVTPTEQYYLRITRVYSSDAVEREQGEATIRDVSEIDDPALRSTVEAILSEGKIWRAEIPEGLRALTDAVDFFTWEANADPGETATHWGVGVYRAHSDREPVVEFDAELVDDRVAPGDPGVIALSLTNTGDHAQEVFSGTVPPFSVLWADAPGDARALLWRDYTEEGCVNFGEVDGEAVMTKCAIGVWTPIDPGETIEKRYELQPGFDHETLASNGFDAPGHYTVAETLDYHPQNQSQGPSTLVDWTIELDLRTI